MERIAERVADETAAVGAAGEECSRHAGKREANGAALALELKIFAHDAT